jgi:hypothetical protein
MRFARPRFSEIDANVFPALKSRITCARTTTRYSSTIDRLRRSSSARSSVVSTIRSGVFRPGAMSSSWHVDRSKLPTSRQPVSITSLRGAVVSKPLSQGKTASDDF